MQEMNLKYILVFDDHFKRKKECMNERNKPGEKHGYKVYTGIPMFYHILLLCLHVCSVSRSDV